MAPPLASAKLTLRYPLYASDFDPQSSNFLLVGGGGGEGRTGVGNKITLIDTSRKQTISEAVEVNLSRDEDSVTSLAVASSSPSSLIAFAGINSSEKDQNAGRNEHFRSFRLEFPPRKGPDGRDGNVGSAQEFKGQTAPLGRASLFKPSAASKKETYQRITRLSRPCKINGGQLGAIATGLAPEGEIVLFDAKTNGPMGPWVEARISLGKGEAADIDIIGLDDTEDVPPGSFTVAYCSDHMVHAFNMTLKQEQPPEPQHAYSEPDPSDIPQGKARPKFRSLRFVTPNLLVVLQNRSDRQGADLLLLELSAHLQGRILNRKRLHSGINSATALSVTHLPPSAPSHPSQHVIAVAGQDTSISIFTLEHPSKPPFKSLELRPYTLLKSVHPSQITSLSFSSFNNPLEAQNSAPPQYIKLASTSIANTVVVHSLPLRPCPPPSSKSPRQRYVLASPGRSESAQLAVSIIMAFVAIALGMLSLQTYSEIRGVAPEYLGAKSWLNKHVQEFIASPSAYSNAANTADIRTIIASDSSSSAATVISSFTEQASSSSSSLKDQATSTLSNVKDAVTGSSSVLKDQATGTLSNIKDAVTDSPEDVKEAVASALDAAATAASELSDASAAYSATASSTVSSATSSASSAASSTVSSASSTISSTVSHQYNHIRDLLSRHHKHRRHATSDPDFPIPHMIINHDEETGGLKTGFHREGAGKAAKRFEELSKGEREIWKDRLQEAGVWAKAEGEAVLKGVFFGGVAQAVGRAVG
ncbi:MAG: hypothetical protein Q9208_002815 [Pyrenodesmia sp. 3 TL-2023]